ncbi:MAG: TonB-dependent receptor, partial [Bacteroidota bacterium]
EVSPEPRLGAKYILTDFLRLKFAGGLYSQNLIAANSDRDVVNLFYGFLSGPELGDLQEEFDGNDVRSALQKSVHGIFGVEIDITNKITGNVEGYLKRNTQLTNINRNKIYDDTGDNYDKPDYLKKDFIIETGDAYGVDFLIKYDYKRTYLWFVYSLGYVTRYDGYRQYYPHFDRRHNINLVFSRVLGKDLGWEFDARWNLGSGFPFTQTQGYYEMVPFSSGISTDYLTSNGQLGIIYGEINDGRLPYYHRLDLTVKRRFTFRNDSKLEATLSVTNVYNRGNIFYFDRIRHERVDQLPVMPSLGLNYAF